ncbi:MAG: tetratricopeptide repeat protein [Haliangium ochraceum]
MIAAAAGCATAPGPTSKIVNGRIVVTRAISPAAYEHVARAFLYEEDQRWDDAARELQRALPFDDEAAEIRAHLADLFVRLGRLDDAAEQVKRSLELAATVEGHTAAAHLAEARRDDQRALLAYQAASALARSDESPEAIEQTHLALAEAQLGRLNVAGAHETIRTLADVAPDSIRARIELGALAWALGSLPEAEAALNEALRLEPALVDARLMVAAFLGATGRIPEAKAAFREALERAEDPVEIAEMYLKWLVARGDAAEAEAEADRLTPDTVDDGTVETIIRLERAAGRIGRATAAADQAVKKGVRPERVALLVAGALVDAKDHTGAAARLLRGSKAGAAGVPGRAAEVIESQLRAAEALREGGRPEQLEQAKRVLDDAAKTIAGAAVAKPASAPGAGADADADQNPGAAGNDRDWKVDLAVARALLDEKRGDAIRAVRTLDDALAKDANNPRLLLVRAAVDERRGEWRSALAFADKVLAVDPRHVEALNFHGFVSVDHDSDLPVATRRLQVAMALNPGAGGIVDSLGWAYLHAGDLTRAAELLVEADRLEPGDPEILSHLAELFAKRDDVARAIATYRRALQRDPPERLARDINARLRVLEAKRAAGR